MAVTSVRIHPAIGFARVGNSPDEFFVGPEKLWDPPDPPGGFKDGQCRVKRQAARFRLFAYHDDGSVEEVTDATADISWTVHLANRKAISRNPTGSAADLTIDPGPRTLDGPDQQEMFDDGEITLPGASAVTVPLGEARTDDAGRLLVLGGFGNAASPTNQTISHFFYNEGWFDDVSDGPVTAHVKLDTGEEFDAAGAWVIAGPPKFAPQLDNVITLYDTVFQLAVTQGWLSPPATPSYTNDIYPILERARTTRWLEGLPSALHSWADPVYDQTTREAIFNKLQGAGGNMPQLNSAALTPTQHELMLKWKDGDFTQDWAGPPQPSAQVSAAELDVAALSACVGAAFYPGIEAGGIGTIPVMDTANWTGAADPLRLNQAALTPGAMTEFMALPWQADFSACADNWWPVPRPNQVFEEDGGAIVDWARGVASGLEMVTEWNTLGFVLKQGDEFVEVDRCDTTFIALLTPHLHFQDVPEGPMGMARKVPLAISFEVRSTGGQVTLEVAPGGGPSNARLTLDSTSVTAGPTSGAEVATARLWVLYETGPVGELISDSITVQHAASGRSWTVGITASTVARKVAAAALVLDRSGSMSEDRGDGQTKHASLQDAADVFVDVMLEGDSLGIVRYNQDAQKLQDITPLGPPDPNDPGRQASKGVINGPDLTPQGATSIGDGIFEGRQILNGATADVKSLVVVTDGVENRSRWISDVAAEINEQTYAVGIGRPENTSAAALQTLSGNNGGYLLVTGPITGDNQFVLKKHFLQILAGVSSAEIVLDPDGTLVGGEEHRIPFLLTEADAGVEVILLTEHPYAVDFRVQTPNGFILEPWRASAEPEMLWSLGDGVAYYRFVLPTELAHARYDHAGTWHALLTIGRPRLSRPDDEAPGTAVRPDSRIRRNPSISTDLLDYQVEALSRRIRPRTRRDRVATSPAAARAATSASSGRSAESLRAAHARAVLPYSLLVHTYSNLSFRAVAEQSSHELGTEARLFARVAESGLPSRNPASVWAEVTQPDGSQLPVTLAEDGPGEFGASFTMSQSGVYSCRVRASGNSRAGHLWQREQTVTVTAWRGGDSDGERPGGSEVVGWLDAERDKLCDLLRCIAADGGGMSPEVERWLHAAGVDVAHVRRCLAKYCKQDRYKGDSHEDG